MKTIEIFDSAMCCPTGLCGPNINPELFRIAVVLETLKRKGILVARHNLRLPDGTRGRRIARDAGR